MLYNLLVPFSQDISLLNVFRYITFRSAGHFPSGPVGAEVKCDAERSFLYVLHTMAWENPQVAWEGKILLHGEHGTQKTAVSRGRELADMWNPRDLPNGAVATKWPNGSGANTASIVWSSRTRSRVKLPSAPTSSIRLSPSTMKSASI